MPQFVEEIKSIRKAAGDKALYNKDYVAGAVKQAIKHVFGLEDTAVINLNKPLTSFGAEEETMLLLSEDIRERLEAKEIPAVNFVSETNTAAELIEEVFNELRLMHRTVAQTSPGQKL